jgi:translation initiation factor eIF-2B subunit gamma
MLSSHRDAHIYFFPAWILDLINQNEELESIGEDVLGWWAKAGWQEGLSQKLHLDTILNSSDSNSAKNDTPTAEVDFEILSSTYTKNIAPSAEEKSKLIIPPLLAYVHLSQPSSPETPAPLIRRADTGPLLLSISLQIAKLEAVDTAGKAASPFAHPTKVAHPEGIAARTTVTRPDCLLAENVIVEEKSSVKECVIGANSTISTGAKLLRCVVMDGVVVGKNCKLTGCILGRRSRIGDDSVLTDCEVQENLVLAAKSKFLPPSIRLSMHLQY